MIDMNTAFKIFSDFFDFGAELGDELFLLSESGDSYVMSVPVPPETTAKDITIEYESNGRNFRAFVEKKSKNSKFYQSFYEKLPDDADESTIEATLENGKLIVSVTRVKLEVREEDANEPEEDKIKRI